MLVKMLDPEYREHLLQMAIVIAMSDSAVVPADYGGGVVTVRDPLETELLEEIMRASGKTLFIHLEANKLHREISLLSPEELATPAGRVKAARVIMRDLLEDIPAATPSVPKIMLYDLALVALCDGSISEIQMALLKDIQQRYQIHDFVFEEIVERAQALTAEVNKATSLVME